MTVHAEACASVMIYRSCVQISTFIGFVDKVDKAAEDAVDDGVQSCPTVGVERNALELGVCRVVLEGVLELHLEVVAPEEDEGSLELLSSCTPSRESRLEGDAARSLHSVKEHQFFEGAQARGRACRCHTQVYASLPWRHSTRIARHR